VADYFTMHNTVAESNVDQDLGSGGALVLPDLTDSLGHTLHLAVGAGKDAIIYIVNRDSMGKFNPTSDNIYQEITSNGLSAGVFAMPAYFNGTLYYGAVDSLKAFAIASAQLVTPPSSKTASTFAYPGTTPSISANGTANGIVWAVQNSGGTGILHAYDATNLANELYNSNQAGTRDQFSDNKFITPMIANGKVYVGTPTGVVVFGLLSGGTPPPPPSGTVTLQNTNSNLCIDTGGSAGFTALIQSPCSTSNTQKFSLTAAPVSGWYYLVSAASNLCWDVTQGSRSAGALIQQYTCVAVSPEYYQLKAVSSGYEILSANMANGCLDIVGASTAPGAHIEQNTCTGSANQIFNTGAPSNTAPTITTQPGNQTVTAGQTATFTAAATGSPTPTVQWQVSTGGGAFSNVSGATSTSTTLSFTTALSQNGNQYRAVFTNAAGPATTTAATLTVNAAPPPSGTGAAQLITPAPGASGVDPFQAFTWTSVPGAQVYYIYVGTSPGQTDIYNSGQIAPTITSRLVPGLLGAKVYYVTLWTKINNTWYSVPSSFSTASQPLPSDANTFRSAVQQLTGNVRLMTQGATNSPIPGTLLAQVVAEDGVPVASCEQYAEALTRLLAGQRISARMRNTFFDGTNYEAHVIAEYYDPFLDKWIVADATFGVVYWNPGTTSGMSIDDISSAVAAKNWSFIQPFITYTTSNGQLYSHNYYMDPILLFLNPSTTGLQVAQLPLPNSPVPFFTVHADTDIGESGVWLFSFVNQTDMVIISGGGQYGPLVGTIYSKAIALNTGWSITSRPSGMQILTMNRYLYL